MLISALEYFSGRSVDAFHVPWSVFGHFIPWPLLFLLVFSLPPPKVGPASPPACLLNLPLPGIPSSPSTLQPDLSCSNFCSLEISFLNFLPVAKSFLLSACSALIISLPQHLPSGCRKIVYVHLPCSTASKDLIPSTFQKILKYSR